MKILAVSDQIIDRLYTSSVREVYPDIQMIIGCGDLPYPYLEFLTTVYNVPLLYVPGNHDPEYSHHPASRVAGGDNVDGEVVYAKGLLVTGLGGCIRYQSHTPNQYSQWEMYLRAYALLPKILLQKLRYRRPLDLFIAHSPPAGIHDDDDPAHQGMRALNFLIRWARPRYFLHGHTIFYRQNLKSHITSYYGCQVVNVYPYRIMNIE
ncbi:MAG: metallophosphoesterase [Anaerolineales bacterium]|nr:metallophosphoesterase [Anaerolineales bacterium]MCX7755399.1 metallophosphoesterase [Anaerolineales bacterium]MDW8278587.1 metallophosphoesterase [Anaerolineales bacterium]